MGCPFSKPKTTKTKSPISKFYPQGNDCLPPPTIVKLKGAEDSFSEKILKNHTHQYSQTDHPESNKTALEVLNNYLESQKETNRLILSQLNAIKEQNNQILKIEKNSFKESSKNSESRPQMKVKDTLKFISKSLGGDEENQGQKMDNIETKRHRDSLSNKEGDLPIKTGIHATTKRISDFRQEIQFRAQRRLANSPKKGINQKKFEERKNETKDRYRVIESPFSQKIRKVITVHPGNKNKNKTRTQKMVHIQLYDRAHINRSKSTQRDFYKVLGKPLSSRKQEESNKLASIDCYDNRNEKNENTQNFFNFNFIKKEDTNRRENQSISSSSYSSSFEEIAQTNVKPPLNNKLRARNTIASKRESEVEQNSLVKNRSKIDLSSFINFKKNSDLAVYKRSRFSPIRSDQLRTKKKILVNPKALAPLDLYSGNKTTIKTLLNIGAKKQLEGQRYSNSGQIKDQVSYNN